MLTSSADAAVTTCKTSRDHDKSYWSYRLVDHKPCWYRGHKGRDKSLLAWAASPARPARQPEVVREAAPLVAPRADTLTDEDRAIRVDPLTPEVLLAAAERRPKVTEHKPLEQTNTRVSALWLMLLPGLIVTMCFFVLRKATA